MEYSDEYRLMPPNMAMRHTMLATGTMEQSWADELRSLAGGESGIVEDAIIWLV
jgi:hypothetical protein